MRQWILLISLMALLIFTLGACDQLANLQNNNTRIVGDWQTYSSGFLSDSVYSFDEGFIKKDDLVWGSYSFPKHSEIEVSFGNSTNTYMLEFVTDNEMLFYEIIDGKRYNRYEWRR